MKRFFFTALSILIATTFILVGSTAIAGKPQNVIEKSNGFPSGMHFNLNMHGKDWLVCNATPDEFGEWGNSIFIPEYGNATIEYISNKKASVYELTVLDPCAGFEGDDDVAQVQLPYKVEVDGAVIPADGYYVFGRILGKPNNGQNDIVSSIILYPNVVKEACNDPGDEDFGDYTSCNDLALGVIVGENLYTAEAEQYVRFDPEAEPGKGKSKATDITPLFTYSGWAVDARLDFNGDGIIDDADMALDPDLGLVPDLNGDLAIDLEEWLTYYKELDSPMAWYLDEKWIFEIADLVVTEQGLVNDGTKLFQLRFYPVATTEFNPAQ